MFERNDAKTWCNYASNMETCEYIDREFERTKSEDRKWFKCSGMNSGIRFAPLRKAFSNGNLCLPCTVASIDEYIITIYTE